MGDQILLRLMSLAGIPVMICLAWGLSEKRKSVPWRLVFWGLGLQFMLGILILLTPLREQMFVFTQGLVDILSNATEAGATTVFGSLATDPSYGALFAFKVLPTIIFVSSLSALLYHFHVIQTCVRAAAWLMRRTLGTSGAETIGAASLIFVGIESVTAIRAYITSILLQH